MDFEGLGDLNELDEMPPFGEDLDLPDFSEEPGGGGISRTFKIVGILLFFLVVAIAILIIAAAMGKTSGLTSNQQTSTAVALTNVALATGSSNTVTAIAVALQASQTAVRNAELASTTTQQALEAQQTQEAINAANTSTAQAAAQAAASQTAMAATATQEALLATQEAANLTLTATQSVENTLKGEVVGADNTALSGVTIYLYRDNGDGRFNPVEEATPVPSSTEAATATPESAGAPPIAPAVPGEVLPIGYGQTVQGQVQVGYVSQWSFTGTAGDVVTIDAIAGDPVKMDMFLSLLGPDGTSLTEDDDSGEGLNASIQNYTLPASGQYTIQASSLADAGAYTLRLTLGGGSPTSGGSTVSQVYAPHSGKALLRIVRPSVAQAGDTETPTPQPVSGDTETPVPPPVSGDTETPIPPPVSGDTETPIPPPVSGDTLITDVVTGPDGTFDFGALDPGVYWLEIDYNSLPPDLKEQIPPTQHVTLMVIVPTTGEVTFMVTGIETPPPNATAIAQTMTAIAVGPTVQPLVTLTETPEGTVLPTRLPEGGLFSDVADKTSEVDSTNGLILLAIAAVGLIAIVFIARKLRTAA